MLACVGWGSRLRHEQDLGGLGKSGGAGPEAGWAWIVGWVVGGGVTGGARQVAVKGCYDNGRLVSCDGAREAGGSRLRRGLSRLSRAGKSVSGRGDESGVGAERTG